MSRPTIAYGTMEQPLHTNAQYLLMQANLGNGTYASQDFIQSIHGVSLDGIAKDECRKDVETQRTVLTAFAGMAKTVTIKDYEPNMAELESFVNTTLREMHAQLSRRT